MAYFTTLRVEARDDVAEAVEFHQRCRDGLGKEFVLCVEEAIARIKRNPHTQPDVYKGARRLLLRRFPYAVYYVLAGFRIVIVAILKVDIPPDA